MFCLQQALLPPARPPKKPHCWMQNEHTLPICFHSTCHCQSGPRRYCSPGLGVNRECSVRAAPEAKVPEPVHDVAGRGPQSWGLRLLFPTSYSRVGCAAGAPSIALSVSACGVSCPGPGRHPGAAAPHRRAVGRSPEHGHRMPHHVQVKSRNRPSTEWPAGVLGSSAGAGRPGTCWAPGHISSWGFTPRPGGRRCILAQVPGCQGERGWAC